MPERRRNSNIELAAADQLHNLKRIISAHLRLVPARAGQNIAIALDGDTVLRHPEVIEQRRDIQPVGNFPAFPVDRNRHEWNLCLGILRRRCGRR
ncbi:MAG TPA: hypothetical protein VMD77_08720, partial [Candidatus Baltobacteraceae bacterium]|nr:hypothetical protein [Candidatus Baltobacteraceae bacterium]